MEKNLLDNNNTKHLPILKTKCQLNKIITESNGSPDYLAINIYYDTLRSWHVPHKIRLSDGTITYVTKLKTKGIYISYKDLQNIHSCSTETLRRKLVKLENLGLIQRSFKHRDTVTTKSYNQLIVYVWKENPHFINEFGVSKNKISKLTPQTNHLYIQDKYNVIFDKAASIQPRCQQLNTVGGIHTLEDTKKLISSFSNEKDRSIKSNFSINKFSKKLSDFYPLSTNDWGVLKKLSGRDFTLNAMNEILLSMSKRLKNRIFHSKNTFIHYMGKALKYEMRDAVKTATTNFKINANKTTKEQDRNKKEQYLSELEYSLQVGPQWHFRKKIASVLDTDKAYEILTAFKDSSMEGDKFILRLNKNVVLSQLDKEIILSQAKASHECFEDGEYKTIQSLEVIQPEILSRKTGYNWNSKRTENMLPQNVWGRVRKLFIDHVGQEGHGIDHNWLSRFEPQINDRTKQIKLKAPSELFKNWVESNYGHTLARLANSLGFRLVEYKL